ncbi:MAG: DUF192 domain-containing protein [Planctomycetes bacterium]|nr:DUF192 domain-containing protein [Planctomycetota bacterium]
MSGNTIRINGQIWTVEIADTTELRTKGLAGRPNIPAGTGMLFVFPQPAMRSFWMEGCLVPLDLVYIDSDMRITDTHEMKIEPDLKGDILYPSGVPVQYALELPAGEIKRLNIKPGDRAQFSPDLPPASRSKPDKE